jgi:predicted  nucleic acid-binding Zn-ribbon protein
MAKTTSKAKEKASKTKEKSAKPVNEKTSKDKPVVKKPIKKEEPKAKSKPVVISKEEPKAKSKKESAPVKEKKVIQVVTPVHEAIISEAPTRKVETENIADVSIEKKLAALYSLQQVDSEINKIRIVRGELPLEVQDLEDEIEGLETRIENFNAEIKEIENEIKAKKAAIKEHQSQIKKYEAQQMNVRNNREYDSITKEIEFQTLEIQLCEKKIKEFTVDLEHKTEISEKTILAHKERKEDLTQKKVELEEIVSETEKEEKKLVDKLQESQKYIEERLISAYQRIKKNARNGLAVVMVERDACGGCFNKIPPQRQLDIKMHKKIIVCEYCGRILVDSTIDEIVRAN